MSRLQILLITFVAALPALCRGGGGARGITFMARRRSARQSSSRPTTVAFATIPNGASIIEAYQTSQAKLLFSSPNMKPLHDEIVQLLGSKNVDLIHTSCPISAASPSSPSPNSTRTIRTTSA